MMQKCIMGSASGGGSASHNPEDGDLYKVFFEGRTSDTAWPSGIWAKCTNSSNCTLAQTFEVGKKYLITIYYNLANSNQDFAWVSGFNVEQRYNMRFPDYGATGIQLFFGKATATSVVFNLRAISGTGTLRAIEYDYEIGA